MDKIIVTVAGTLFIGFIAWFFFGVKDHTTHEHHH